MKKFLLIYFTVIAVMSLIAFFVYMADKIRARKNEWRIRESVLLGMGVFGGAAGALIAMKALRHKTKHWYFWAVNLVFFCLQIAAAVFVSYYFF